MKRKDYVNGCNCCGNKTPHGRFVLKIPPQNGRPEKEIFCCKDCYNKLNPSERHIKSDDFSTFRSQFKKQGIPME